MKKIIAVLFSLLLPAASFATNSQGTVTSYLVGQNGILFFHAGNQVSKIACSNGDWAVNLNGANAAGGKAILATVLLAQSSGKSISVVGTGTCDVWGDRESVNYVYVTP